MCLNPVSPNCFPLQNEHLEKQLSDKQRELELHRSQEHTERESHEALCLRRRPAPQSEGPGVPSGRLAVEELSKVKHDLEGALRDVLRALRANQDLPPPAIDMHSLERLANASRFLMLFQDFTSRLFINIYIHQYIYILIKIFIYL